MVSQWMTFDKTGNIFQVLPVFYMQTPSKKFITVLLLILMGMLLLSVTAWQWREAEVARDRAVGRPLRLAADARNGFSDIDRGQHAQFE